MNVLEKLFQAFQRQHIQRATSRFRAFETYCQSRGIGLRQFATFQVLAEHFGTSVWRQWPTKFHSSESKSVQNFQRKYEKRMRFFQYVQWQCEHQLAGLHRMAHRMNMKLGLYHDLPVGVHPDGADAWMFQDELAAGVTVGAPPDPINLCGQNWGLRAPVPWRMREMGYRFFIETLRRNMQYAGTLRIDHALGLFRLFVIPEGCSGESGMYVKTQVDEILAILALESERHRVMVVGEDLGTVTPEIRTRLTDAGILSYRLMPFEKTVNGKIRSPRQFPKQAVVSFTTHDLPTVKGYWTGRDIEVKTHAGLYPTERHGQAERDERLLGRVALIRALVKERILPKRMLDSMPDQFTLAHIQAIYLYLARTPSRLLIVPLEDLLAEREAPNLPGASSHAYPSWQLRLGQSLEAFRHDSHIHAMAKSINDARLGRSSISTHLKLR